MAEKLSESTWTGFAKKQKLELDDKALVKALAAFDKTVESKPAPRLKALDEVIKEIPEQVKALVKRKKELGDKPFGAAKDQLYELLEVAERLHKETTKAEAQLKEGEDDEKDEEPGSILLDPDRLFKALTSCRRNPDTTMDFGFVDARGKGQPAVLALHRKMDGKKIFSKLREETGAKTGAYGSAWVDGTSLMLQLDKPLSGLVKKVRGPVKACGFKIAKAVLWNADGTVFEQDDQAEDAVSTDAEAAVQPSSEPGAQKALSPQTNAFKARLKSLLDLCAAAGDTPASKQAKLLGSEAGMFSRKGDWTQVDALMKQAEALVSAVASPAPGAASTVRPAASTTHTAPVSQKVAFIQTRLAWEKTRNHVRAELKKLQEQLLSDMKDDPDFASLSKNSVVLYRPLEKLDERLMTKLDDALNATTPERRNACHQEALAIVDEYMNFARTDELLRDICDNGFIDVDIESVLVERLAAMAAQLKTAIAA